ncbi:phage minor tail protein G [Shigella flexneri]|nr:phage minor tail protein G [Shigella flexneri]
MFLKQDTFNYEKQSVVLSELSGLQRIEYLTFVQQRTAKFDAQEGELPEAERQIAFLRMGMDINAWLVSRSLWNAEQSQDVETLCASIMTTWSYDALGAGAGAERVLSLSGMGTIENAGDDDHEALTPEKS